MTTPTDKTDSIEVGDIVKVFIGETTICASAHVLGKPCATGDSWRFKDASTGDLHYISEGCTVTKRAPR